MSRAHLCPVVGLASTIRNTWLFVSQALGFIPTSHITTKLHDRVDYGMRGLLEMCQVCSRSFWKPSPPRFLAWLYHAWLMAD